MKNCLFCKHFNYETGSPGYSEYTPGEAMEMGCALWAWQRPKKYWQFSHTETTEDEFRAYMTSAETCKQFWDREIPVSDRYLLNADSDTLHIMDKSPVPTLKKLNRRLQAYQGDNGQRHYVYTLCNTTAVLHGVKSDLPVDSDICKKCLAAYEKARQ